ncbi:MAG: sigma factor [Planctomycetota bacterium]|jgi:RNA polymerase sigma factor (sigma-70 family)
MVGMPEPVTTPSPSAPGGLAPLLERLARDDRETDWAELIVRYGGFIRSVCQQHLHRDDWVDDAVQESLIRLQRALERFERRSEAEAWGWLRLIATGCARHILESEQARLNRERVVAGEIRRSGAPADVPDGDLSDQKDRLLRAMRALTPLQCEILRRRFVAGESNATIAAALGQSEASVQKQGHRALVRLRGVLGGDHARPQRSAGIAVAVLLATPDAVRAPAAAVSGGGLSIGLWAGLGTLVAAGCVTVAAVAWPRAAPPASAPAPAAIAGTTAPAPVDPATAAFIRRFQERHPGWRRVDAGNRLGDAAAWRRSGPWTITDGGAAARVEMANPETGLRAARIALVPAADARRTARLLVATLDLALAPGRTGFRLAVAPAPQIRTAWAGLHVDAGLTPDRLLPAPASETAPAPVRRMAIGVAVDRQDFHFLLDGETRTQALDPGVPVEVVLTLYGRSLATPTTAVLHDVQVFEADQPPP